MAREQAGSQGVGDGGHRVVAAEAQRAIDAHEDGLRDGPLDAVAESGVGQGVGHDRLDVLFAGRAVVAMDGVLDGLGGDVGRDVDDDAGAGAVAPLHRPAAARADIDTVFLAAVDVLGLRATRALVPRPGPWPAATLGDRRLDVEGHLSGRRGRADSAGASQLGDACGSRQGKRGDCLGPEGVELVGLFFAQLADHRRGQQRFKQR